MIIEVKECDFVTVGRFLFSQLILYQLQNLVPKVRPKAARK